MLSMFGAEKDEDRLLKASRNLYDCVYMFASSTNTIFRMLNQFLGTDMAIITIRENLSIKENLQLLISALKEMQEKVDVTAKDVQQQVSHLLYSKIVLPSTSVDEKLKLVKQLYGQYKGNFENICGPISAVLMKNGNLPDKLDTVIRDLMSSPVLSLRVADLLMTKEEIVKALPDSDAASSQVVTPGTARARAQSQPIIKTTFSLTNFMRVVFKGQPPKKTIELAADCLEEAVKILKPACENFQSIVKTVQEYVTLIVDKLQ
ncbi:uncharacterized protein LOC133390564 [Rhineura floridana]|uniref:uncharacterized protein LOC133390564 n=1 Tax=Rhineura floridana TaxID=261503 RepID=UPI002AC7FEF3|nr:uncharacterized protein LOC133390564 [Rhineura floridana]XP_061495376.1 uncharacterized protein LOC133390564 [Rhineura floridana]XP_061495378.1 uncharacterized protein LOC133390564 [Rhineura floridana]XP_061495379.1 uncharacterized protein LOC133390564 [Rhineura floridana]XP_061495380.1 uncharacterized protein LOC133390564 [Rhineura floridana]XP_061495381.1 uncharacterized protein LOC133390564 [Rhineura floridana]XP_061495382.1 uncharacterized protein LOC133390564 [Rhineura floridana]XP_0